jgi:hypothetical protein
MCIFNSGAAIAKQQAQLAQGQANQAAADAAQKQQAITTGMTNINNAFAGFDQNYFDSLAKNYTDYATPQLQDQYNLQKKNIIYNLARGGNLGSSVYGDQMALLDKQNAQDMATIQGTGQDYANTAKQNVQSAKQNVVNQLNTTYDVAGTNTEALQQAQLMAATPSFSPLGSMFANVSALAAQNKLASQGYGAGMSGVAGPTGAGTGSFGYSVG